MSEPNNPQLHQPKAPSITGTQIALGVLAACAMNCFIPMVIWLVSRSQAVFVEFLRIYLLGLPLLQWVWLVPVAITVGSQGRPGLKRGIFIGGSLVVLLYASAAGYCFYALSRINK